MATHVFYVLVAAIVAVLSSDTVDGSLDTAATAKSCKTFLHRGGTPAPGTGGFFVYSDLITNNGTFEAGNPYQVLLASEQFDLDFSGFSIEAVNVFDSTPVGEFTIVGTSGASHVSGCSEKYNQASVVEKDQLPKTLVSLIWTAPETSGQMDIRYTVDTGYNGFIFGPLSALENRPSLEGYSQDSRLVRQASANNCPVYSRNASSVFPLTFRFPEGCERRSCDYYVAMGVNEHDDNYLDIYMEAKAQDWVAIGFSQDNPVNELDVITCYLNDNENETVSAVDAWKPSNTTPIEVDVSQDDICLYAGCTFEGRIMCQLSRNARMPDENQDHDLKNGNYLLVFSSKSSENTAELQTKDIPDILGGNDSDTFSEMSDQEYQVFTDRNIYACPPPPDQNSSQTFKVNLGETGGRSYIFTAGRNRIDNRFLDMTLSANAKSWVAVGFSATNAMGEADVLACVVNSQTGIVEVKDAWNPDGYGGPQLDKTSDGLCYHSANYTDGTISCSFSRFIDVVNEGQDLYLYGSLYQLYAAGDAKVEDGQVVSQHETIPEVSFLTVDIENSTHVFILPHRELTRLHGVLMILAWPFMAMTAIFMAAWVKPAMPRGEWLEMHWLFMVAALMLTIGGIASIVVANYNNKLIAPGLINFGCGTSIAHFVFGVLTLILLFASMFMPHFSCKPGSPKFWIYTLLHGIVFGRSTEIVALINIALGITVYEAGCEGVPGTGYKGVHAFTAFALFQIIINAFLYAYFSYSTSKLPSLKEKRLCAPTIVKLLFYRKDVTDKKRLFARSGMTRSKQGSLSIISHPKDNNKRWIALGVYVPISMILSMVMMGIVLS